MHLKPRVRKPAVIMKRQVMQEAPVRLRNKEQDVRQIGAEIIYILGFAKTIYFISQIQLEFNLFPAPTYLTACLSRHDQLTGAADETNVK